jgi:hypothetical protein
VPQDSRGSGRDGGVQHEQVATSPPPSIRADDAERAVLGAMLTHARACDVAIARLTADDFYLYSYGRVFGVAAALHKDGVRPDTITVSQRLQTGPTGCWLVAFRRIAPAW